jgi:hypothetical protein
MTRRKLNPRVSEDAEVTKPVLPKIVWAGAACAVLAASAAQAAGRPAGHSTGLPWVISPEGAACRTDLELAGRSGATAPVVLASDGERLVLRFAKAELPERAFLPIRIDQKPYSNLMQRAPDGSGELTLSDATQAAMRKGATLSIAWLSDEPVSAPLGGSEYGVPDLKTCGAQVAGEARERAAAAVAEKARADAEGRAQAIAEAQLQAARAQQAAAEAERQRQTAEAQRLQAQAAAAEAQARAADQQARAVAYQQSQPSYQPAYPITQDAYYEQQRQRAYEDAQRRYNQYDDEELPAQPVPYYRLPPSGPPAWGRRGRY